MNAFKHGVRSRSLLLPGDDVQEFLALRSELVRQYRPGTREELRCVHRIADCEWLVDRYADWETACAGQLDASLEDPSSTVAPLGAAAEWLRAASACGKQEARFENKLMRTERRLFGLQALRRMGLLALGDAPLEPDEVPSAEPVLAKTDTPTPPTEKEGMESHSRAADHEPETPASASADKVNEKCDQRECGTVAGTPVRQAEPMLREALPPVRPLKHPS